MAVRSSFYKMGVIARQVFIQETADLGERAIKYAFNQRHKGWFRPKDKKGVNEWYSETGNLHDSFGSAVYVSGQLQVDTIRYVDNETWSTQSHRQFGEGRKALNDYLRRFRPTSKKNEVTLVVIAAMPYASILENKYKIYVISEARQYIDEHWHEIETNVYKKLRLKKPDTRVIKGNMRALNV